MNTRQIVATLAGFLLIGLAGAASAQGAGASETDLKNVLVWNSPWEGRAATPGNAYSYRTVFHARRDAVVAEVVSYATNQRSDSVVEIRDGRLTWQDAGGADVNVALADGGDLVGMAVQQNTRLPIVLKPRR